MSNSPEGPKDKPEVDSEFELNLDQSHLKNIVPKSDFDFNFIKDDAKKPDIDLDLDDPNNYNEIGAASEAEDFPIIRNQEYSIGPNLSQYINQLILNSDPGRDPHEPQKGKKLTLKGEKLGALVFALKEAKNEEDARRALDEAEANGVVKGQTYTNLIALLNNDKAFEKDLASEEYEEAAFNSLESGDFYSAMQNALKIEDLDKQTTVLWDLAISLIKDKKFDKARTIIDLIKDESYKERLNSWIDKAEDLWEDELVKNDEADRNRRYKEWVSKWKDQVIPPKHIEVDSKATDEAESKRRYKEWRDAWDKSTTQETKIEKKEGRVNHKVYDVMNGLAAKIKKDEVSEFKELREEMSGTTDYEEALAILSKYSISIPAPERKKIMACFEKPKHLKHKSTESHKKVEKGKEKEKEEIKTIENSELEKARSEYATQLIAWKNKNREKKWKITKLFNDLGVERQVSDLVKSPELLEAERVYIEAKKEKSKKIITEGNDREAFVSLIESERNSLQKEIDEAIPPLEKGIILKGMEKWSKMSKPKRIAITATVFFLGGVATGGSVFAAASYAGYKGARSAAGMLGAMGTGKVVDKFHNYRNEKKRGKEVEKYAEGMNLENFAEREKALMIALEKESNKKKRQRLYKAGAMMATGFGLNYAAPSFDTASSHLSSAGGVIAPEHPLQNLDMDDHLKDSHFNPMRPEHADAGTSDGGPEMQPDQVEYKTELGEGNGDLEGADMSHHNLGDEGVVEGHSDQVPYQDELGEGNGDLGEAAEAAAIVEKAAGAIEHHEVLPINVELSPKGFIQDIIDLKQKLRVSPYEISEEMKKNLMDKSPIEIAKEYGMYDPEHHLSGMSIKGGHLGIDSDGHLVYEYQGKASNMFDYEHGHTKSFEEIGGRMFEPKAHTVLDADHNAGGNVAGQEEIDPTNPDGVENPGVEAGLKSYDPDHPEELPSDGGPEPVVEHVDSETEMSEGADSLDAKRIFMTQSFKDNDVHDLILDGQKIAHKSIFDGKNIAVLEDKFMEGKQYAKIREEFNLAFVKSVDKTEIFGDDHIAEPFERDSMIDIAHKIPGKENEISVFLNGKKIAEGIVTERGPSIKLLSDPTITHHGLMGWLMPDTVYERAFKVAKKLIEEKITKFYV